MGLVESMDKSKVIHVFDGNDLFYLEVGDGIVWITDLEDASHPATIALFVEDVPILIKALESVIQKSEMEKGNGR